MNKGEGNFVDKICNLTINELMTYTFMYVCIGTYNIYVMSTYLLCVKLNRFIQFIQCLKIHQNRLLYIKLLAYYEKKRRTYLHHKVFFAPRIRLC